jgi:hypothetical protein
MKPVVKNMLAVVAGLVVGSVVNMGLILLGGQLVPPPQGADVSTMEGLKLSIHLFEPRHFVFPFLAHALGTLAGAIVAALVASSYKSRFALVIGAVFLVGGIANVAMIPAPAWFNALDLIVAYIPMAWLGGKLAIKL